MNYLLLLTITHFVFAIFIYYKPFIVKIFFCNLCNSGNMTKVMGTHNFFRDCPVSF